MPPLYRDAPDRVYSSLDHQLPLIRLLILQTGDAKDILQCNLGVVNLDEAPAYEALSYVWGETTQDLNVHVAKQPMVVTDNLHAALRHLRLPDRERTVWVDALCINQDDDEEKMHQVSMMSRIFQQCLRCIVWLGTISPDGEYTLEDSRATFIMITLIADGGPEELPPPLSTPAGRQGAARALHGMMVQGNQWWKRMWTVQEAVFPKDKLIVWETLSIPWETCVRAARGMMKPTEEQQRVLGLLEQEIYSMDTNEFISPFLSLMMTGEEAATMPLFIAHRWRYREATDPRDKVYGLMGLFNPTFLPSITCDYTKSPADVFTRFALDMMRQMQSLAPLIGWRGEEQATADLPSWALDMVRPEKLINWGCKFWEHWDRHRFFSAAGDSPLGLETLRDCSVLVLKGIMVDTVTVVDEGIAADERVMVPHAEFIRTTRRRQQLVEDFYRSSGGHSGSAQANAFFRTLLGDVITRDERVRRRAEDTDEALFDAYLVNGGWNDAIESLQSMTLNQAFIITETGYLGVGPPQARVGDQVWILVGSRVPFLLRPKPIIDAALPRSFEFLGDAYVHDIMDGQLYAARSHDVEPVWIV
ncbi:heterokaryon incompatibility protein-domain-containing protein [Plectosphaerella plurivora]|uniref:Heterokaryon incompatibility protein-domain-containing protein n=1 Tax=Plectosphaerella plurivora TaxID=936078 RepID=A0A9P8VFI0_9PEZI|nr:heterokaryon incompatibility protein-domain-containing protein [Plectosphaerella plurivora]